MKKKNNNKGKELIIINGADNNKCPVPGCDNDAGYGTDHEGEGYCYYCSGITKDIDIKTNGVNHLRDSDIDKAQLFDDLYETALKELTKIISYESLETPGDYLMVIASLEKISGIKSKVEDYQKKMLRKRVYTLFQNEQISGIEGCNLLAKQGLKPEAHLLEKAMQEIHAGAIDINMEGINKEWLLNNQKEFNTEYSKNPFSVKKRKQELADAGIDLNDVEDNDLI